MVNCHDCVHIDVCITAARMHVDHCNDYIDAENTVEVVRCKDCIHWDSETGWCYKHSRFYNGGMCWDMFNDDDFCSFGERRIK